MVSYLNKNCKEIFNFDNYLDNIAIITDKETLTYKEVQLLSKNISKNISKNALVFLLPANDIESISSYIAILQAQATCALINSNNQKHLKDLIEQYKPHYLILENDKLTLFKNWDIIYQFRNYSIVKSKITIDYPINSNLSLLLSTSGSTGSPKFVRISSNNIKSNTQSICEYLHINSHDRTITTLPFYYSYGLSIINTHLYKGASIVLTNDSIVSKTFWELFKKYEVNNFGGVPYTYEILKKLNLNKMDLSQLRYITQAGGKLNHTLVQEFHTLASNKNFDFFVMYGQTEATARMSYLPLHYIQSHSNSIGVAIPGGKFELIDTNNKKIKDPNLMGELIYHGQNVSLGYASSYEDLSLQDENNNILYTGDLAKFDENNLFYIVGRKKRFCKIHGNRINLDEIEQIIKNFQYEAICTGNDNKIFIFTQDAINETALISQLSKETALHHSIFKITTLKSIPRNESGKIQYSKLEELAKDYE